MILPGGLVGLGAGIIKNRSVLLAVVCGLLGTAPGFFTDWHLMPFREDPGLGFYLRHVSDLKPIVLLMIAVGGFLGFRTVLPPHRERQP